MKDDPGPLRPAAQDIAVLDERAASAEIDRQMSVLTDLLNKIHQRNPLGLREPATADRAPVLHGPEDLSTPGQGDARDIGLWGPLVVDESWTLRPPSRRQSPSDADLDGSPRVSVDKLWRLDDWAQAEEIARHFSALLRWRACPPPRAPLRRLPARTRWTRDERRSGDGADLGPAVGPGA